MNCSEWEERIALYAEGDLPPQEAAEAGRHLAECGECREFAEGLQQSLAVLRAAHAEPLALAHLAVVRARVLERVEPKRRPSWRWAVMAGLAAAALVPGLFLFPRQQPVPSPRIAVAHPPAPAVWATAHPAPPALAPKRLRVRRGRRTPPRPAEPLMVKLVSDDPTVVIYWIAN
ncbi:MAG: zf-HC2 domain-containing protein [Acidobacteriia bacterium]|nr:zf-HC2 domain-containing protein [Terriglobia bacterium]